MHVALALLWRGGGAARWLLWLSATLGPWMGGAAVMAQPLPAFTGKPLSMNFQHIEVRTALHILADFSGLNIVTSDSVTGSLTLRLHQVPWDQVLDIVAQAKGLSHRRQGNVIWVAPRAEVAAREKLDFETQAALQSLEPLQTQSFLLNYAKAADVHLHIQGIASQQLAPGTGAVAWNTGTARMLSLRGSVLAEPRTNQLFVTDIASRLEQVAQMVAKIDVPLRQVMIEARIVQAGDTFARALGVRLGGLGPLGAQAVYGPTQANALANANPVAQQATNFNIADKLLNTSGQFVNLPAGSINGFESASFAVSIFNAAKNQFLNLELSALESDGKGKVMSSPRVVTADQAKAIIEQGTELPYQMAAASGATAIAFRKANLKLEVTPQITPEGGIVLDLDIHKDSVGQHTAAGFAIDTKHVNTQVLVDNGGTVMIGGIYETTQEDDTYKVPGLGDLPVVGQLFQYRRRTQAKQELLVFITPKILDHSASAR